MAHVSYNSSIQITLEKDDFRKENLYNYLQLYVKGKLLDIGCGTGNWLSRFKDAYGIDADEELLKIAKKEYPYLADKFILCNARDIDSLKVQPDTITMIDLLEHIEYDIDLLQKIYAKKSKYLIIVVPAMPFLFSKRDKFLGHFRRYTPSGLKDQLEMLGFKVEKLHYWNFIGVLPYMLSKTSRPKNGITKRFLFWWFKNIENNVHLPFGLSLICIAKRIDEEELNEIKVKEGLQKLGYLR